MVKGRARLLLLFAFGLGVAALVRTWFSGHAVAAGLWGIEDCTRGGCTGVRWDNVPNSDLDFLIAGYGGTAGAMITALLGAILAVAGLQGRAAPVPVRAARFVSTFTLAAIAWFTIRMFTDSHLDLDWGLPLGVVCAIGVAATLPRRA